MDILQAFTDVAGIFIMIAVGALASKLKWIDENSSKVIEKITLNVMMPCSIFYSLVSNYDKTSILKVLSGAEIPFLAITFTLISSFIIGLIIRVGKNHIGTFVVLASFSSSIFIGLPTSLSILGRQSVPYWSIFYIVNALIFWFITPILIKRDGMSINARNDIDSDNTNTHESKPKKNIFISVFNAFKFLINPVIIFFILAIVVVIFSIKIPSFIMSSFKYFDNATTAFAMIYIGSSIHDAIADNIINDINIKDIVFISLIKFLLLPMFMFIILKHVDVPQILKRTFLLISFMPSISQSVIIVSSYKADTKYAIVATTITLLLTPLSIILYLFLLSKGYI